MVAATVWRNSLDDEELRGAYLASTALWFPSIVRSEAFGLVQIEAMASGCPVINTSIPGSGVSWVSLDGISGCTVPIQNPVAFAEAARSLVNNPALREELSVGATQRANEIFDIRKMTARTMHVYESILHPSTQPIRVEPVMQPHLVESSELIAAER